MGMDCGTSGARADFAATPSLTLQKYSCWCDAADAALRAVLAEDRESMIASVNAGRCELWSVNGARAWLITHVEFETRELIVCCVAGEGLSAIAAALYRIAQRNGLTAARFFTQRPALARLLRGYGFQCIGRVYRCEIAPNVTQ